MNTLTGVCCFLFGAFSLSLPNGYSIAPILLLVLAIPFLFQKQTYQIPIPAQPIVWAFLGYFLLAILFTVLDSGRFSDIDRPSRAFLLLPALLLLLRFPPKANWLLAGLGVGALAAGGLALYQSLQLDMVRATGHTQTIQFGNISLSLGMIAAGIGIYLFRIERPVIASAYLLMAAAGILGSLLSGSRGGWITLPILLLFFFWVFRGWQYKKTLGALLLISVCIIPMLNTSLSSVGGRIEQAQHELTNYLAGSHRDSSVGQRLQMWQSAWLSFQEKPLLGWGKRGIDENNRAHLEANLLTSGAYFNLSKHAHNQYLDTLSKQGLVGLIGLLAIFVAPLWVLYRLFKPNDELSRLYFALGGSLVISVMGYNLTQCFLSHNSGITFYCAGILMICAAAISHHRQHNL